MGLASLSPHTALLVNICIGQYLSGTHLFAQTDETQTTSTQWSMSQQTAQPWPQTTGSPTCNKYIH